MKLISLGCKNLLLENGLWDFEEGPLCFYRWLKKATKRNQSKTEIPYQSLIKQNEDIKETYKIF